MVMWKLRNCPRCQGDLFLDRDMDGWYQQCLQCGYRRGMKPLAEAGHKPPMPETERVPSSGVETPDKRRPVKSRG